MRGRTRPTCGYIAFAEPNAGPMHRRVVEKMEHWRRCVRARQLPVSIRATVLPGLLHVGCTSSMGQHPTNCWSCSSSPSFGSIIMACALSTCVGRCATTYCTTNLVPSSLSSLLRYILSASPSFYPPALPPSLYLAWICVTIDNIKGE